MMQTYQAHSIPAAMVEEFEKGVQYDILHSSFTSGGATFHTVSKTVRSDLSGSEPKCSRTELDTTSSGYVPEKRTTY